MRYLAIVLALLTPALGMAQRGSSVFPWWETSMVRDLNLTTEQSRQIKEILRESRGPMSDLRANLEKAEAELEVVFQEEQVDQKKASESIEKIARARAEMTRGFSQLSLKLRGVLTTEQWRELQRRNSRMRGRNWASGPGPGPDRMERRRGGDRRASKFL